MDLLGGNARKLSKDGQTLYAELDLLKGATENEIKRQYRKLALKFHPDKNPDSVGALEKFKGINRAHRILMDSGKRKLYDKHGSFGLYLAETVGEENVGTVAVLSTWWCQGLLLCSAIFSCGFCCCCCCCCCGKWKHLLDEEVIPDADELERESQSAEEKDKEIFAQTEQPRSTNTSNGIYTIPMSTK